MILKIIPYLCTLKLLILFINIMNSYETVFILTPVLSDDQAKEAVQKFESEIANLGGKLKHSEKWGLKKLAYPIQKKTTGFYFLLEFEGEGDIISNLELSFKRDERVMRFLTVKMDVNHLAYAEKRRAKMGEAKTAKAEA
jgi:small subunit ribosomal protein S6